MQQRNKQNPQQTDQNQKENQWQHQRGTPGQQKPVKPNQERSGQS